MLNGISEATTCSINPFVTSKLVQPGPSWTRTPGVDFPQLDLASFSRWRKPIEVIRFLPVAYETIAARQIHPRFTFHFVDRQDNFIGIAAGDICYPATFDDVEPICRLVVQFEDRRFFSHHGIDLLAILRSLLKNIQACRIVRGGSTITQQLARNTLLTPDRSLSRKIAEILLALKIERHYSKKEILLLYSQLVYLGNGVRGFPAASKLIYRRSIQKLDNVSACGLIGLLRHPSTSYPSKNLRRYLDRQRFIVGVHQTRTQSPDNQPDVRLWMKTPNPVRVRGLEKSRWTYVAEKFVRDNITSLNSAFPPLVRVGFTVDRTWQSTLDGVLHDVSLSTDVMHVSGVILDNSTADLLAESAWSDGHEWDFSPTFFGELQPGSTFKTFAYLAALESGFSSEFQLESRAFDSSFVKNSDGSFWHVRNYGNIYRGYITLREALQYSDNTVFARLAELITPHRLESAYRRFGLCGNGSATPAIVLGASVRGVSLLELASAYCTIARNGLYKKPRVIRFVQSADGSVVHFPPSSSGTLVIRDYAVATELKSALRHSASLLSAFRFSGKTGTTKTGSFFAGYNDAVSLAIWLRHRNPAQREDDRKGMSAIKAAERWARKAFLGYPHDVFTI